VKINFKKKISFKIAFLSVFLLILTMRYAVSLEENYYFEIQYGNFKIGQIDFFIKNKNNLILVDLSSNSDGVTNILYKYKSKILSKTLKTSNDLSPVFFNTESFYKNKKKTTFVKWDNRNEILDLKIEPPLDLMKVYPIPGESLTNVIHPITAFLKVIEKLKNTNSCEDRFRIFDGRRRYDLLTKNLGDSILKNDRPKSFSGKATICGVRFFPIGGHRLKSKWKPEKDKISDIKIFFGKHRDNLFFPVRLTVERWFGNIIVRLINK
jgi:hypothetical protein